MPTTSWTNMRARIARAWGYHSDNTTTDITNTNAVVSTALTTWFPNDNMLKNWFVRLDSATGVDAGQVRRINAYTGSTGAITTAGVAWSAQNTVLVDYDFSLYRYFHPADILIAFEEAANDLFPAVALIDDNRSTFVIPSQRFYDATARLIDSIYLVDRGTPGTGNGCWLNFDGETSAVTATDATGWIVWGGTNGGVGEAWIYPRSTGENGRGQIASKINWLLYIEDESTKGKTKLKLTQTFDSTAGKWSTTDPVINLYEWSHIAVQYDSGHVDNNPTFIINGTVYTVGNGITEDQTPVGTEVSDSTELLSIGGTSGTVFDGYIDELRLWVGARTTTQLSENANRHLKGSELNLVAYFPMDRGVGTTLKDLSQVQSNATISGATWVDNRIHELIHDATFHAPHSGGTAGYIEIPDSYAAPSDGVPDKIIRMVGRDLLSTVSADTDTFEVDGEMLEMLVAKTRLILAKNRFSEVRGGEERDRWRDRVLEYQADVDKELNDGRGMSLVADRAIGIPDA